MLSTPSPPRSCSTDIRGEASPYIPLLGCYPGWRQAGSLRWRRRAPPKAAQTAVSPEKSRTAIHEASLPTPKASLSSPRKQPTACLDPRSARRRAKRAVAKVPQRLTSFEVVHLTAVSRRGAGLDAPASATVETGCSACGGRAETSMVAGRGGAVGATIARRAGGARARPCTQKAIDLPYWLPRCPAGSVYIHWYDCTVRIEPN